jgi:hypothetical protein
MVGGDFARCEGAPKSPECLSGLRCLSIGELGADVGSGNLFGHSLIRCWCSSLVQSSGCSNMAERHYKLEQKSPWVETAPISRYNAWH